MNSLAEERSHFDSLAARYNDNYRYDDDFTQYKIQKKLAFLESFLRRHQTASHLRILEVGSGTGEYTRFFPSRFPSHSFIALELSERMIEVARVV